MGESQESAFESVITINSYNHSSYRCTGDECRPIEKLQFKRSNYYATFIATKDLIISPLVVSRNIEEEDIAGAIEEKAYEELGLDVTTEYIFEYKEIEGTSEGRQFEVFIFEQQRYDETFEELRSELKYIDLITPAPLLYKSLYQKRILDKKRVHAFLYFTSYDTTLTFYQDGEYLYSKTIKDTLISIYDRYCETLGKTIDEKEFFNILKKDGLKTTDLEFQENITKLFNDIFLSINDVFIYTKRAYDINIIDEVFIGSELGPILGADEYASTLLGLHTTSMNFDFGLKSDEWYIDQQHLMLIELVKHSLESGEEEEEEDVIINFSQYPRPPIFPKRASGQFIISLIATVLLASAYPIYFIVASYVLDVRNYQLKKEEGDLNKEVTKYRNLIARKISEFKKVDTERKNLKKIYIGKEKTLISVYNKKIRYHLKSNQMAIFATELSNFGLMSDEMISRDDNYSISILGKNDQNITNLIKDITNKYSDEIKRIDINDIYIDGNSSMYRGVLKVDLK